MKNEILYDLTTHDLSGLKTHFNLSEENIFEFYNQSALNRREVNANSFLQYFNIDTETVLNRDIFLTSLHLTTTGDNLASIKKMGLVNLQKAITLETPFKNFLVEHGIVFNVEEKFIKYKEKIFDISQSYNANLEDPVQWIIYKLFIDFSTTSFFSVEDATEYLGEVHKRPEFLKNVAEWIGAPEIIDEWVEKTDCYVIKYRAKLEDYSAASFNINVRNMNQHSMDTTELQKRLWIINKALDNQRYGYKDLCFSYMNPEVSIPYSNFISVYNLEEYKMAYKIR